MITGWIILATWFVGVLCGVYLSCLTPTVLALWERCEKERTSRRKLQAALASIQQIVNTQRAKRGAREKCE